MHYRQSSISTVLISASFFNPIWTFGVCSEVSISSCLGRQSCHRHGPKTVQAQTAETTKFHVIFIVFFNSWIKKCWWWRFQSISHEYPIFYMYNLSVQLNQIILTTKKYWWQYIATVAAYPLSLLPLDVCIPHLYIVVVSDLVNWGPSGLNRTSNIIRTSHTRPGPDLFWKKTPCLNGMSHLN